MSNPVSDPLAELIDRAAASSQSVLIWHDDVAERRSIATAIHERSARKANAIVHVACAPCEGPNVQEHLQVDLFGHEAGAFSAGRTVKAGILETAHGGSVLVDDVAMLDPLMQWTVFHASESSSVIRIGGISELAIDVRFIFATGADLPTLVREGRFREDFFRKMATLAICLPATRDLSLPDPLEFERIFHEFPNLFPCPRCAASARRFRQLRDGYLVCGSCGQSFIINEA